MNLFLAQFLNYNSDVKNINSAKKVKMQSVQPGLHNKNALKKPVQDYQQKKAGAAAGGKTAGAKPPVVTDTTKIADTQISQYLTLISRLENRLNQETLSDEELDKILTSLAEKVQSLSQKSRERLFELQEFKELKIEETKELKEELEKRIEDKEKRKLVFDFLKSKGFVSALENKPVQPATYQPMG